MQKPASTKMMLSVFLSNMYGTCTTFLC